MVWAMGKTRMLIHGKPRRQETVGFRGGESASAGLGWRPAVVRLERDAIACFAGMMRSN